MNHNSIMQELFQRPEFDGNVAILINVIDGKLQVTPFGGSFEGDEFEGEEVYGVMKTMLEAYNKYAGIRVDAMQEFKHLDIKQVQ